MHFIGITNPDEIVFIVVFSFPNSTFWHRPLGCGMFRRRVLTQFVHACVRAGMRVYYMGVCPIRADYHHSSELSAMDYVL